jgi:ATP-dependent Clp protease adaptor protein ClpS
MCVLLREVAIATSQVNVSSRHSTLWQPEFQLLGGGIAMAEPTRAEIDQYKVLLLNDDHTPMEFVVEVLERFFDKGREEATRVMLQVHHKGVGICGAYTHEVGGAKVAQVMEFSSKRKHPLKCVIERQ